MLSDVLKGALRDKLGDSEELADMRRENAELRRQLDFETQRSAEYFSLIERMEKQRDERWEMFITQACEHGNAQALLEDNLMMARTLLTTCVEQLNAYRVKDGLEPVKKPLDFADPPIGTAAQYRARMAELRARADALIEGRKERQKLVERFDLESPSKKD